MIDKLAAELQLSDLKKFGLEITVHSPTFKTTELKICSYLISLHFVIFQRALTRCVIFQSALNTSYSIKCKLQFTSHYVNLQQNLGAGHTCSIERQ